MKNYVFWNSKSGKKGEEGKESVKNRIEGESVFVDVIKDGGYKNALSNLDKDDRIYLVGGDGTLNHFINDVDIEKVNNDIYYYPSGTGNDFLRDIEKTEKDCPVKINKYLEKLPYVEVNGKTYRFLNGIGFGIDGYCCLVGDRMKKEGKDDINYTAIAIKGLLFHYKPTDCTIIVDGKKYEYKKVWLCPTMNGRYYGGGMMATPLQNRLNGKGIVSSMLFYGKGKIKTLMAFPSIFSGEHIKKKGIVAINTGHDITVTFSRPTPLQIDGETIDGVTKYRVYTK